MKSYGQESAASLGKSNEPPKLTNAQATRETVESIVVAVILAFLFRSFVAEAFVIPTGSMAPTLQGNHKDITCPQCKYQYQASASCENETSARVSETICPICQFENQIDVAGDPYHQTFTGDRIIVSKFSYDLGEPQRWDVIVFKYPGNAKQNYIKRLIGLPNETIRIRHGDVYVKTAGDNDFHIVRKPPHKIKAMLQLVDDTNHIAEDLKRVRWLSRWQPWPEPKNFRTCDEDAAGFEIVSEHDAPVWMRYRHHQPTTHTWRDIAKGQRIVQPDHYHGRLIVDSYAYNAGTPEPKPFRWDSDPDGWHWVGDLGLECDVEVKSATGIVWLDLVEGGVHHQVSIDVASGKATASIPENSPYDFTGAHIAGAVKPFAFTPIRGPGRYQIRLTNVDHALHLWVNEQSIAFHEPTTYDPGQDVRPVFTLQDPADLAPAGIGAQAATIHVHRARILRDAYYVSTNNSSVKSDYDSTGTDQEIWSTLDNPESWATSPLFGSRRATDFVLERDQFFPMGDNSPQSSDARMWHAPHYVDRDLLTGKAVMVYWPHPLPRPVPIIPNVPKMRLIR